MTAKPDRPKQGAACVFEHLTGPSRGHITMLGRPDLFVAIGPDRFLQIGDDPESAGDTVPVAHLWLDEGKYILSATGTQPVWVNGTKTERARLSHGDIVEFGELGPISRFRMLDGEHPLRHSVDELLGDSIAYMRASRRPFGPRIGWATSDFVRRLLWETTLFFRIAVMAALLGLGYVAYQQYRTSQQLQESLTRETARLEGVASALARAREEALRPGDLKALRDELSQRVTSNVERLEMLEERSGAVGRVIAASSSSVVFLQSAYGLRHVESGEMLRHVVGPDGIPLMSPTGQPLLAITGTGPVAEVQTTGTGFLLRAPRVLVTNRHVARPWEANSAPEVLQAQGLEPVMLRAIGYFPASAEAVDVATASASETADLAILEARNIPADIPGLPLAEADPMPGEVVIVMGYPAGLRSMLAQTGPAFVAMLEEERDTNFWSVAERLAAAGIISPLSSRGIVGKVGAEAIVYDAETTHGGSGGPVLNDRGEVVAINAAILPEFGGSNLGVPAGKLRALLEAAGN